MTGRERTAGATLPEKPGRGWHELEAGAAVEALGTDRGAGLGAEEAARRLSEYGPNELEERGGRTLGQIIWEQVSSILIVILVFAGILAAALGRPYDTVAILAIVVLFVVLGVVQEYRAQKAIAALKQMAAPMVRAVRDGRPREISARDLVPGDLVLLETGSVVPADMRIVESVNLRTQEAALTGESVPVEVGVGDEVRIRIDDEPAVHDDGVAAGERGRDVATEAGNLATQTREFADDVQSAQDAIRDL